METRIVTIDLDARSYDIFIGAGLLYRIADFVPQELEGRSVFIVADQNVEFFASSVKDALSEAGAAKAEIYVVKPGEQSKSFAQAEKICLWLLQSGVSRNSLVFAVGGGVVGDVTGFCASIILRGVPYIQIPTTLLAQVDSSVGGKTGINAKQGKNLIGSFYQPAAVIADIETFKNLPKRELLAGYAEIVKYGLISDVGFFNWLEREWEKVLSGDKEALVHAVETSVRAKAAIVQADEKEETGQRALLNFGHTFGHALEAAAGFDRRLLHGEAVAIGMCMAFDLSARLGLCMVADLERVERHIASTGLPTRASSIDPPLKATPEKLIEIMRGDKKAVNGKMRFIVTSAIGQTYLSDDVPEDLVLQVLKDLAWRAGANGQGTMEISFFFSVILIFFMILGAAFFAGSETAITAASRSRMHMMEKNGNKRAALVNKMRKRMDRVIGAMLLGNTLVNILSSALATAALIKIFGPTGVIYAAAGMTVLMLIFGEVMPKTYAVHFADRFALFIAPALHAVIYVLSPFTDFVAWIVRAILKIFGIDILKPKRGRSLEHLRGAIELHSGPGEETQEQRAMLRSILDLFDVGVEDIMIHRRNVLMIDGEQPLKNMVADVLDTPYTRLPVWKDNQDNIVGVLHVKLLLRALNEVGGDADKVELDSVILEPWFVPETTTLYDQLQAFRERREHFAIVVDEYGALKGIVTLEDILEEIVGEIDDENDVTVPGVRRMPGGKYLIDGEVTIRDLNREFEWGLPDEEYSTLAGLLLYESRTIPEVGHSFIFHGFRFDVMRRHRNQITVVRVTPPPKAGRAKPPEHSSEAARA